MAKKKKRRSTRRRQATRPRQPKEKRLSRREQIARARRQKQRRGRLLTALVVAVVVVAVGVLIWLNSRPLPLTTVERDNPAGAHRAAWGPPGAVVIIEEWSDFQ